MAESEAKPSCRAVGSAVLRSGDGRAHGKQRGSFVRQLWRRVWPACVRGAKRQGVEIRSYTCCRKVDENTGGIRPSMHHSTQLILRRLVDGRGVTRTPQKMGPFDGSIFPIIWANIIIKNKPLKETWKPRPLDARKIKDAPDPKFRNRQRIPLHEGGLRGRSTRVAAATTRLMEFVSPLGTKYRLQHVYGNRGVCQTELADGQHVATNCESVFG